MDSTPKNFFGKRYDKTNSKVGDPKENYEWEEEQPSWATSNKAPPPTPTATTTPTLLRPDGSAAGKKEDSLPRRGKVGGKLFFPLEDSRTLGETRR